MKLFDKFRLYRLFNDFWNNFQKGTPMKSRILAHWKTTIVGAVIAGLLAVQAYNGNGGWKGYVSAAVVAALGALAKDN